MARWRLGNAVSDLVVRPGEARARYAAAPVFGWPVMLPLGDVGGVVFFGLQLVAVGQLRAC